MKTLNLMITNNNTEDFRRYFDKEFKKIMSEKKKVTVNMVNNLKELKNYNSIVVDGDTIYYQTTTKLKVDINYLSNFVDSLVSITRK